MLLLLAIQKYLKNFSLIVFIHSERKFLQQEEKSETYFFFHSDKLEGLDVIRKKK